MTTVGPDLLTRLIPDAARGLGRSARILKAEVGDLSGTDTPPASAGRTTQSLAASSDPTTAPGPALATESSDAAGPRGADESTGPGPDTASSPGPGAAGSAGR